MPGILELLNVALPELILLIKSKHAAANPNDPPITDEQIHAAMLNWLAGTIAKDDAIINGG